MPFTAITIVYFIISNLIDCNISFENGINIPSSDNPSEGENGSRAPFTDRRQRVSNKNKNRFADFNFKQLILS